MISGLLSRSHGSPAFLIWLHSLRSWGEVAQRQGPKISCSLESESHTTAVSWSKEEPSVVSFVGHCPGSLIRSVQALFPPAFKWVFAAQIQMPCFSFGDVSTPAQPTDNVTISAGGKKNVRQEMIQSCFILISRAAFLCNGLRKKEGRAWLGRPLE